MPRAAESDFRGSVDEGRLRVGPVGHHSGDGEFWPARVERVTHGTLSITYSDGDTADLPPAACVAAR